MVIIAFFSGSPWVFALTGFIRVAVLVVNTMYRKVLATCLLATKSEKWNGKPRLECFNGRHPPSKAPVGVLPWICRNKGQ